MRIAVQVAELRFATEDGVLVFDGLSFGVPREGFVWVVGPPGSGKTLLLSIILREVPPASGQVLLLGRNLRRLSPGSFREIRRRVGFVPESPVVLEKRSVRENLEFKLRAMGLRGEQADEAKERALDLAQLRGLEEFRAEELDSLHRLRLALALALLPETGLLLCDDPLRALEPEEGKGLLATMEQINRAGVTILATASNAAMLEQAGFSRSSDPNHPRRLVFLRELVEE